MATINSSGIVTLSMEEMSVLAQARGMDIKKMGLSGRILEKKAQGIVNAQFDMQAKFRAERQAWSPRR